MLAKGAEGVVWDEATLSHLSPDPKAFVPGTKMTFPGLKNPEDVANVIAYLKFQRHVAFRLEGLFNIGRALAAGCSGDGVSGRLNDVVGFKAQDVDGSVSICNVT